MIIKNLTKLSILAVMVVSSAPAPAFADNSDGFKLAYNLFFGTESERKDLKECRNLDTSGSNSVLGAVNAFFCVLEKGFGITEAPTENNPISLTKAFDGRDVHVELVGQAGAGTQIAAGFDSDGTSDSSVGYDYTAKVWVCHASGAVTCSSPADFEAALSIAYSFNPDGTVNKGNLLEDPNARDQGVSGAALSIIYNVGANATSRKIAVKFLDTNGDKMRIDGADTAGMLDVQMVQDQSSGKRFSAEVDPATGSAAAAFAQNIALSDTSVAPDPAQCFIRVADESSGDWDYSLDSGASCSVSGYTDSVSTVNGYTATSILGVSSGIWSNGMTLHPSSL